MISNNSSLQLFSDTDSETENVLIALLRDKQAAGKLRMVNQLNASVRRLALSGLRERYPECNEIELKLKLAQLLFGTELAQNISSMIENRV
jgi:hypothetical protein